MITLVLWYTDWCPACQHMKENIESLLPLDGVEVFYKNCEAPGSAELMEQWDVDSYPTICLFQDGKECDRVVGVRSPDALLRRLHRISNGQTG